MCQFKKNYVSKTQEWNECDEWSHQIWVKYISNMFFSNIKLELNSQFIISILELKIVSITLLFFNINIIIIASK